MKVLLNIFIFSISFTIFFQNMIISTTLKVMSSWNVTNENNHTVWCYRYWGKLSTVLCCFKHISPRWVGKIFVSISHIAMHCTIQGLTVVFNEACSEGQWHNWLQKEAITYEVIHSKCSYGFGGANTFLWTHQCRHSPILFKIFFFKKKRKFQKKTFFFQKKKFRKKKIFQKKLNFVLKKSPRNNDWEIKVH